jgi:hypothetical protein
MKTESLKGKFQLIRSPQRISLDKQDFLGPGVQEQLFPVPKDSLIVFLEFSRISDDEFTTVLDWVRPSAVLELRRVPRFDVGQLNRKEAFKSFKAVETTYFDLTAQLDTDETSERDMVHLIESFLKRFGDRIDGPFMVLINNSATEETGEQENVISQIVHTFASFSKRPWESVTVPRFV